MSGYTPNKWVDREGTTRYFETIDADGAKIFTPDYTQVTEMGTPVNEDNMNHIEEGIAAGSFSKYGSMTTYEKDDLVTAIIDNELKVYKSLQDNNNGNTLTDTTFWEEVEFAGGGAGLQLFDVIEKDHILTYEESKGLALLGTYVYKEAVAGSRYGYPDFYNKVVAEKEAGTATETTLGENTVTMYVNSNGHTFYDIADKGAVDAFYNTYGVAWYYGVDTENERIFLPRNDYFFKNGTVDDVGLKVKPELPNITGSLINVDDGGLDGAATGAFVEESNTTSHGRGTENSQHVTYSFDASRSSKIYKDGGTVVADGVNVLVYMCVGNTETKSTITDVVEVTTTENDTIPLFTGLYFDFKPNNVSWLKAGQQANNEGIYKFVYNELVNELTTPKYGLKVIETKDMVSGEDYSLYWKVNQEDMTFTTPLLDGSEDIIDYTQGQDITSGYVAPYRCIGYAHAKRVSNNTAKVFVDGVEAYRGQMSGDMVSDCGTQFDIPQGATVTTSGTLDILKVYPCKGDGSLYFKVANAVQNLELLDAGEVLEAVADKISRQDCKAYITETYKNGTSWYRVYSDGWCEQGGFGGGTTGTISLLKPMVDTNYQILCQKSGKSQFPIAVIDRTATSFTVDWDYGSTTKTNGWWQASGYIA